MSFFDKRLINNFVASTRPSNLSRSIKAILLQLKVEFIQVTGSIPKSGPVLLISDHFGGLDSFILISSFKRPDFYFVAIEGYKVFGRNLNQHLLPIYHTDRLNTKVFEYPKDLLGRKSINHLSSSEVKKLNQKTIAHAAKLINQGQLVSIFPMGKYGRSQPGTNWKIGLGYLIKQINNPQTKVVFAKIAGSASHDFLRFIVPFWRKILFRSKEVGVSYSSTFLLTQRVNKKDTALEIVQNLEKRYQIFTDSLDYKFMLLKNN